MYASNSTYMINSYRHSGGRKILCLQWKKCICKPSIIHYGKTSDSEKENHNGPTYNEPCGSFWLRQKGYKLRKKLGYVKVKGP